MIYDEFENPMQALLASVKRPGRYTGGEWGSFVKNMPNGERAVHICLAFPDVYEVGMSYLGYQILYSLIKTLDNADAERAYCPWPDMEREMRASGIPLTSLESFRPLRDFDILGFTLQYELNATNILTMLDLGGIPLKASERGDSAPIVIGGGGGACSPAPLEMFFDAFCIGEGEERLPEIIAVLGDLKGRPRDEKLDALARLRNVYVPGTRARQSYGCLSAPAIMRIQTSLTIRLSWRRINLSQCGVSVPSATRSTQPWSSA